MAYNKVCIIVGNGFVLDYLSSAGIHRFSLDTLHPSFPLQNFKSDSINYKNVISCLPDIEKLINSAQADDFQAISQYLLDGKIDDNKECQLRRFLAFAYSKFQLLLDDTGARFAPWKWTRWFRANNEKLACAISFNYDVILERALFQAGLTPRRLGVLYDYGEFPVIKPHGSIDFDLPDNVIFAPDEILWGITTKLNESDAGVKKVPKADWLRPRVQADIIPPTQENYQKRLSWIREGYEQFCNIGQFLDCFVIIGFRCSSADKREFIELLERLPKDKVLDFYIVNINIADVAEITAYIKKYNHNPIYIGNNIPW